MKIEGEVKLILLSHNILLIGSDRAGKFDRQFLWSRVKPHSSLTSKVPA
ncbi:MAG: hypothetical protein VW271_01370 [Chloroflexota bacterium]